MVRAEKWDDRERILNILINGDSPCRRLFLDYRGLKLLYNWMVNLPLPSNECKEQLIRNEEYHKLVSIRLATHCQYKMHEQIKRNKKQLQTLFAVPESVAVPSDPKQNYASR